MIFRSEHFRLDSARLAHRRRLGLAAVLGLLWYLAWYYGLDLRALGEPDEGRYAEVAREMLASGDWLTPRLDGFDFFDKPALHYWATAAAYAVFGVHAWTARLWCALTGMLAIVAVGWAGMRVFGRQAGGYAAAILGSSLLFVMAGHIDTLDMGVAAFMAVGLSAFLVAQFDPAALPWRGRLNTLAWLALGLAVLSKGLIGVVLPGGAVAVYMLWRRDASLLARIDLGRGLALVLLIGAPWYVAMSRAHPGFFDYFFIRQHVTRFLSTVDHRSQPFWFFLPVAIGGLFPWTTLLASGGRESPAAPARQFLWAWAGVILVFFSASHSKLPFYILPALPALALLLGASSAAMPASALARRLLATAALAAGGIALAWLVPAGRHLALDADAYRHVRAGIATALALIAAVAAASGGLLRRHGHAPEQARGVAIHALALAALAAWQIVLHSLQRLEDVDSAAPAARLAAPAMGAHTEIYDVQAGLRGLPFYLGRLVVVVDQRPDDIAPAFDSRPGGHIDTLAAFERRWRGSGDAVAVTTLPMLARLRAAGLPFHELGSVGGHAVIAR